MIIAHSWCGDNNGYSAFNNEVKRYTDVRPSERQLAFNDMKYYNFIHFGVNTFTDREWGTGEEDEKVFNPSELDTDQWCRVLKNTGSKGIILTAKHHDGFCLFDTKYTSHSVMNSPLGKDIAALLKESCEKYGLKLGLYLSPWDRHEKTYGTPEYNDFFVNQLTELCTKYGDIFCFWFDGACGEGANGKKQIYDWDRYYETIRKYQPNAVIAISGPDVRWIGNEGGKVRKSEWSVIPWTQRVLEEVAENSQKNEADGQKMISFDRVDEDLGSREVLFNKADLRWSPAEADVSVNYGWFWHDDEYYRKNGYKKGSSRTGKELAEIYFNTVGGNASMLLNVPPDKRGLINEREIKILNEFSEIIKNTFKSPVEYEAAAITEDFSERSLFSKEFMLQDDEAGIKIMPSDSFKTVLLEEDIRFSQRVEKFEIYADGEYMDSFTVIGSGKIIRFDKAISAKELLIIITQSRGNPVIKSIKLYK